MERQTTSSKISKSTTVIWILLLPLIFGFYALQSSDSQNFPRLNTFFILYIGSGFALMFVSLTMLKMRHMDDFDTFWTNDIDRSGLGWIGAGITLVLVSVAILLGIGIHLDQDGLRMAQFSGIVIAGFIMMICFLKTRAILVPIIIHGTYNGVVTILQKMPLDITGLTQHQLSALPQVPEIGAGILGQAAGLYSELIWQFTIVAIAEEFLKLVALVAVVWIVHGIWKREDLSILSGMIFAVLVWSVLHLQRSI